jgi:aryl-alcohol dehydrogenase-like predicted oxidoreductase
MGLASDARRRGDDRNPFSRPELHNVEARDNEVLPSRPRASYVLATKLRFSPDGSSENEGLSATQVHKQIDVSLRRLRLDYVDLYQCHRRYDPAAPLEETMEALSELVRAGRVRYIGFSEFSPPPEDTRATSERMGETIGNRMDDQTLDRVQRLDPIAERLGVTIAQVALAWVLREENVASAVVGATRPEQVRENAAAAEIDLDPETIGEIEEAFG